MMRDMTHKKGDRDLIRIDRWRRQHQQHKHSIHLSTIITVVLLTH
ncbi:MAG: hypothetical protein ACI90V_014097 [Bacillariaceae sp.]|jgi:hypothetical protein